MRSDMFEVIIERPRRRGRRWSQRPANGRETERARHNPDLARHCESMRFYWGAPWLNENLAPLVRFLESRVGRAWNRVHAEICAEIAPSSAVQKHVLDHLREFVVVRTGLVDGAGVGADHWGRPAPVGGSRGWGRFYVCPTTGVLKRAPSSRPRRHGPPVDPDVKPLDDVRELRRVRGVWYLVHYAWVDADAPEPRAEADLRQRLGATLFEQVRGLRERKPSLRRRVEVARKQLSTREVRRLVVAAKP